MNPLATNLYNEIEKKKKKKQSRNQIGKVTKELIFFFLGRGNVLTFVLTLYASLSSNRDFREFVHLNGHISFSFFFLFVILLIMFRVPPISLCLHVLLAPITSPSIFYAHASYSSIQLSFMQNGQFDHTTINK